MSDNSASPQVSTQPSTGPLGPVRWLAQNLALLLGVSILLNELFPSVAHARRGFPLIVIFSDNPWLMLIGVVLLGVWAYSRFSD